MKQLKLISLLTVAIMLLGMIAACGAPAATPAAQPTAAPAPAEATEAPQATAAPAEAAQKFVVATNAEFAPMEYVDQDKNLTGFDIDLINAIAADQGSRSSSRTPRGTASSRALKPASTMRSSPR
jgi:ABC-type amino acid transport substrate-binding protein